MIAISNSRDADGDGLGEKQAGATCRMWSIYYNNYTRDVRAFGTYPEAIFTYVTIKNEQHIILLTLRIVAN